jgi:cleavage stimulation factor subunit 3
MTSYILSENVVVVDDDDDDDDEYDEPLVANNVDELPEQSNQTLKTQDIFTANLGSPEYFESLEAIELDCWDISSWIIFLEEIEQGRGGQINVNQAYTKILAQFPLSAMLWKKFIDYHILENNYILADEALSNCLLKCRNVELWQSYLLLTKIHSVNSVKLTSSSTSAFYFTEHAKLVGTFERALDCVGSSLSAAVIWQDYIYFIRNGIVFDNNFIEVGKKLSALRSVFQRAVCVPMDNMEAVWNEYEVFEKTSASGTGGEDAMSAVLLEFSKKHLHAKSIYRDRKRLTAFIEFDRFACPPTHSSAEMQQLEMWNCWIKLIFYLIF